MKLTNWCYCIKNPRIIKTVLFHFISTIVNKLLKSNKLLWSVLVLSGISHVGGGKASFTYGVCQPWKGPATKPCSSLVSVAGLDLGLWTGLRRPALACRVSQPGTHVLWQEPQSVSFSLAQSCQVQCQQPDGQTSFLSPVQSHSSPCSRHLERAIVSHSAGCYGLAQLLMAHCCLFCADAHINLERFHDGALREQKLLWW